MKPSNAKPKFQFSMKTLMLGMTVAALFSAVLGWIGVEKIKLRPARSAVWNHRFLVNVFPFYSLTTKASLLAWRNCYLQYGCCMR